MTLLKINRVSAYADKIRAYHLILDGKKIKKIGNGETVDLVVQPGNHELFLKIDWCRSNKIAFSISEGQTKTFNCGPSLTGINLLFGFVYITFLKNNYLWLKEVV